MSHLALLKNPLKILNPDPDAGDSKFNQFMSKYTSSLKSINQSINRSLFANAITSKQQKKKKCVRLPEQAIAQQSWPP